MKPEGPVDWLLNEYTVRRRKNPSYSLRAFSRQLGVGSGPLSEILGNKRRLTRKLAERISVKLGLTASEQLRLFNSLENDKRHWSKEINKNHENLYRPLEEDTFQMIAEWHHYAIRSLITTKNFRNDAQWMARRLRLKKTEVTAAIERMCRLGVVTREKKKLLAPGGLTTSQDIPSQAVKNFHEKAIGLAVKSLYETSVEARDISSITMAIDPNKLPQAKKVIRAFRRKLAELLEEGNCTEVYQLNIQLFPLSTPETSH